MQMTRYTYILMLIYKVNYLKFNYSDITFLLSLHLEFTCRYTLEIHEPSDSKTVRQSFAISKVLFGNYLENFLRKCLILRKILWGKVLFSLGFFLFCFFLLLLEMRGKLVRIYIVIFNAESLCVIILWIVWNFCGKFWLFVFTIYTVLEWILLIVVVEVNCLGN